MNKQLTEEQTAAFHRDGFLILRSFFSTPEIERLYAVALQDAAISRNSYDLNDQSGKKTRLALWFTPGDDIYGLLSKSERVVHAAHQLMDGNTPVCHFHSKLMQKEPRVGGAWEWHQDYGYWYKDEFLFPDQMLSVMVAVTEATRENGCLQVIKGSHKMGRVEHGLAGEQVGASRHYVGLALQIMELVYVELQPGDALIFHSNLLHRSEANLSDHSRWSLISVYNRQSNIPFTGKSPSAIIPLEAVPDSALLEAAGTGIAADTVFLSKATDKSLS